MSYKLEGYLAFTNGKKRSDCPYPILSHKENQWLKGWNQGKKEEQFFEQLYDDDVAEGEVIQFDLYPERNYK